MTENPQNERWWNLSLRELTSELVEAGGHPDAPGARNITAVIDARAALANEHAAEASLAAARWSKWVAIGTWALAVATFALAIVTVVK